MNTPSTYPDLIDEMTLALTANIEYLKRDGSSQIRIKNGRLTSALESGYIYEFQLERVQDIDVDSDIEVKVGSHSANGKVIAVTDESVHINIDEHLGDEIAQAVLIISSYYLLERLRTHLLSVKSGETEHSDTAEKVFQLKPTLTQIDDEYVKPAKIDATQDHAIRLTLGSDVSFIWGPPGTGKSQTIAYLIKELIERNLSVLLISHTNAATDSVMSKVVDLMERHPDYLDGKFLRIGKRISPDLKEKLVVPEKIMEEKARPLNEQIAEIRTNLIGLNNELGEVAKVGHYNNLVNQCLVEIKEYVAEASAHQVKLEQSSSLVGDCKYRLDEVEQRVVAFQNRGSVSRLFAGTNLDKLTKEKSEYIRQLDRANSAVESITQELETIDREIATRKTVVTNTKKQIATMPANGTDPKRLTKQIKDYDEQIRSLEKQIADLSDTLLFDAKVIATTLTQTYTSQKLLLRKYDVVILDEASMAPLPAVASVAGIANKKICLVGDFFQLPPIARHSVDTKSKSDDEAKLEQSLVDTWLKQDVFSYVGIERAIVKGVSPGDWLAQLKIQYRMHPDISYLINELVYGVNKDFKLENGDNTLLRGNELLDKIPLSTAHIGVYDTSSIGSIPTKSDSGSWYNLPHALVCLELAKQAIASGYSNIGIVSAYRAQVNLINQLINDELPENIHIEADTVHKFQGGAKQIIIFDVTNPYSLTMYDDAREGGDDAKLINVAFSRAEEKCIILADCTQIKSKHSESSLIKKALRICEAQDRPIVEAKTVITDYFADDRTERWLEKLADTNDIVADIENSALVDEHDFYPLFMRDVLAAEKELIIQSAFITMNRLNSLLPVFQLLLGRGVRIFIITRVPWEHDGIMQKQSEQAQTKLEDMGVIVLPFIGKIHQKYAIIDRKLLWEGSLNILSQRDSKEVMRRCVGEKTTKQYMDFMRLSKNIGELGTNKLKHCAVCTLPGSYMWTKKVRGKMWTFCLTGSHSAKMEPKTASDRKAREKELLDKRDTAASLRQQITINAKDEMYCPIHKRLLAPKTGRFGNYWECPLVKECYCTVSESQKKKLRTA